MYSQGPAVSASTLLPRSSFLKPRGTLPVRASGCLGGFILTEDLFLGSTLSVSFKQKNYSQGEEM